MGRVPHLQHDVVAEVDDVVDGPDPHLLEALLHPVGRGTGAHVEDPRREAGAEVRGLDLHLEDLRRRGPLLGEAELQGPEGTAVDDRHLPGQAVDVHRVHAVGGDVEVEDRVVSLALDAPQLEAHHRQGLADPGGLLGGVDELSEPGNRELHPRNCSRKRRSLP